MRTLVGVVLLRSWLQLSDQAGASSLVCVTCCCPLLQRLQRTSYDSGSLVSGNELIESAAHRIKDVWGRRSLTNR
jgi:hypothetical protein